MSLPGMSAAGPYWWYVSTGLGNGLVLLSSKPLPEPAWPRFLTICHHFPCYWHFVQGIHQSLVNSPHKGQWHWDFMFSLICAWVNSRVNNREAGDLRCHHAHYDVIIMPWVCGELLLFGTSDKIYLADETICKAYLKENKCGWIKLILW